MAHGALLRHPLSSSAVCFSILVCVLNLSLFLAEQHRLAGMPAIVEPFPSVAGPGGEGGCLGDILRRLQNPTLVLTGRAKSRCARVFVHRPESVGGESVGSDLEADPPSFGGNLTYLV